ISLILLSFLNKHYCFFKICSILTLIVDNLSTMILIIVQHIISNGIKISNNDIRDEKFSFIYRSKIIVKMISTTICTYDISRFANYLFKEISFYLPIQQY